MTMTLRRCVVRVLIGVLLVGALSGSFVAAYTEPLPFPTHVPAALPDVLIERDILRWMQVGDVRYTTPWAMHVTLDGSCWLVADYPAYEQPAGTVRMQVERADEGYIVYPPPGEEYIPTDGLPYVGVTWDEMIPVLRVVWT